MINVDIFKEKLEKELALVEEELSKVGRKNPDNAEDWEPTATEIDSDHADDNDVADNQESFAENVAVLDKLETQYNEIKNALKKIDAGTYGICEVSGEQIPEERLMANPSARTMIEHAR
jgi:RNA polymerase-binding transcription factor DksA